MTTNINKHIVTETLRVSFEVNSNDSNEAYRKYLEAFGMFYDALKRSGATLQDHLDADDVVKVYKVNSDGKEVEVSGWIDGTSDEVVNEDT
jgi:hypothetical protein